MEEARGLVGCVLVFLFMRVLPTASHTVNDDMTKTLTYTLYFFIMAFIYKGLSQLPLLPKTIIIYSGVVSDRDNDVFLESPTNRKKLARARIKNSDNYVENWHY